MLLQTKCGGCLSSFGLIRPYLVSLQGSVNKVADSNGGAAAFQCAPLEDDGVAGDSQPNIF